MSSIHEKEDVFSHLPVNVSEESFDIYDGLSGYFDDTVEFEGKKTKMEVSLVDLPPILQIQLQVRDALAVFHPMLIPVSSACNLIVTLCSRTSHMPTFVSTRPCTSTVFSMVQIRRNVPSQRSFKPT